MADILPAACCTAPPIVSDYAPTGHTLTITGRDDLPLSLYSTGPAAASKALICIYDIFGMAPNTLQGADVLAKLTGCRIVVPDFFRGRVWDHTNFPPKEGFASLQKWIGEVGEWNKVIRPDLEKVVAALREDGYSDVAAYGFCFGGKKVTEAMAAGLPFKAIAMVHPSVIVPQDANGVNVPVCLLPSNGEDKKIMNDFWDIIQKKPFAEKCFRKDFDDAHHGFAAGRSDWKDPKLVKDVQLAYQILANFFKATL